ALPTELGKVPSSRIRHRQPHLPNRLLHPEFAELALLEGEDDLDGCLYFDWLVVEHIRAIAPGFDRVGGWAAQDGRSADDVKSLNRAGFGYVRAQQDGSAHASSFRELWIDRCGFVNQ